MAYFDRISKKDSLDEDYWGTKKKKNSRFDDDDRFGSNSRSYYGGFNRNSGYYSNWYNSSSSKNYWSSFNWGTDDDDNDNLVISEHGNYITPKESEIRLKSSDYRLHTKENIKLTKNLARYFYHQLVESTDIWVEGCKDPENVDPKFQHDYNIYKGVAEALKSIQVYGNSPLDKAVHVLKEILYQQDSKRDGKSKVNSSDLSEGLEESLFTGDFNDETLSDPIFNELSDLNSFTKKFKSDILRKISLVKNFGSEFKVEKEIEEKIVTNSSIIVKKKLRDFSQIINVELYQRLLPNFHAKLVTKDLVINAPVDRTEHKQKIIMLVDFSGSMHMDEKQKWVCAVLMERLKYVMKEECEIFFSFFVHRTDQLKFIHLFDKKSAINFWRSFSTEPNGGDTYLGDMVNYINKSINEEKRLCNLDVDISQEKIEILAINDGQDSVKTSEFSYKTNAISLMQMNDELKNLCIKNNGKYIYVDSQDVITSFVK